MQVQGRFEVQDIFRRIEAEHRSARLVGIEERQAAPHVDAFRRTVDQTPKIGRVVPSRRQEGTGTQRPGGCRAENQPNHPELWTVMEQQNESRHGRQCRERGKDHGSDPCPLHRTVVGESYGRHHPSLTARGSAVFPAELI